MPGQRFHAAVGGTVPRCARWVPWFAMCAAGLGGCRSFQPPVAPPSSNTVVLEQLVVHTDFPLPKQHRLLAELAALRSDVSTKLKLPISDEPIHVYLFESQQRFREFIGRHYPSFPPRRAFFVETDTRLAVYAYWGDRVAEDLRHEVAHGYLHAVVPNLPLWLDEGLAEYFEVPRGHEGLNVPHVEELLARYQDGMWRPSLSRLERIDAVAEMKQIEYAESWAWVHWMLHGGQQRRELLQDYLQTLRGAGRAEPLSAVLQRDDPSSIEQSMMLHVAALAAQMQHPSQAAVAGP
jgi:hypothetical protein